MDSRAHVTLLLRDVKSGDSTALERLVPIGREQRLAEAWLHRTLSAQA